MPNKSNKRRRSRSRSEDRAILKLLKGMEKRLKRLERSRSNSDSDEGSTSRSGGGSDYSSPYSDIEDMQGLVQEIPVVESAAAPLQDTQLQVPLDVNTLMLLRDDVAQKTPLGASIQPEIAERWLYVAKNGLDESVRKTLIEKYPLPENCALVGPPQLNLLIKQAIHESAVRRDNRLSNIQLQLSAGLSAIAQTLSRVLEKKGGGEEGVKDAIEALNDAGRLITDVIHSESMSRRELASYDLNNEWKNTLIESPIDKWLFGEDLEGRLKAAKILQASSRQLKVVKNKPKQTGCRAQSSPHLNSKRLPQSYQGARMMGRRRVQEATLSQERRKRPLPRTQYHTIKTQDRRDMIKRHRRQ
ncbi:unnamed protein product [Callosobruchus maculatus]|uniref:Uncharacterized protein n=1 Tax=Callosobruchus maculatus TaxID=64391 RepID=A0A653CLW0_CALMS|nr:unnamed protein product [Callosobruchus maculatus]